MQNPVHLHYKKVVWIIVQYLKWTTRPANSAINRNKVLRPPQGAVCDCESYQATCLSVPVVDRQARNGV